jgi:hypothetical protein
MPRHKKRFQQIPQRDYLYLPKRFWNAHDTCIDLIGQIEEILIHEDYCALKEKTILLNNEIIHEDMHILDFFLFTNRKKEHDEVVRNHLITALLTDICYFTQEALTCSLKMRLPVMFALLRKPFVYTLIVILRLLFEEGFIDKFNNEADFDPSRISGEDRLELLKSSIGCIPFKVFEAEEINEWIFDKEYPDSIINLSEMALHLKTTRNSHIATEQQNFNFIFSRQDDIMSQWELIYSRMPVLCLFLAQVSDMLLVSAMDLSDELYQKRLINRLAIMKRYKGQTE